MHAKKRGVRSREQHTHTYTHTLQTEKSIPALPSGATGLSTAAGPNSSRTCIRISINQHTGVYMPNTTKHIPPERQGISPLM